MAGFFLGCTDSTVTTPADTGLFEPQPCFSGFWQGLPAEQQNATTVAHASGVAPELLILGQQIGQQVRLCPVGIQRVSFGL